MCSAAIPNDHDRRWRDNFQRGGDNTTPNKNTNPQKPPHYPQMGKGANKEETLFSLKAYSCQSARVIEIICY